MRKSKLHFENIVIYGEKRKDISPYFLFIEQLEWNKEKHNGHVKSHLHSSIYQILIINNGGLYFEGDHIQKLITEPTIILIPEDHVHSLKFEQPTEGWNLSISLNIIDELIEKHPAGFTDLSRLRLIENEGDSEAYSQILYLCKQIQQEQIRTGLHNRIFNTSSVGLLFYYIIQFSQQQQNTGFNKESKEYKHLRKFKKLIKERVDASNKVSHYASELNITPTHLNRLSKNLTGVSASQTIYNSLISEAKKYLTHSSFTISEIAYILNFKSPSHFSKFYKNQVGSSPKNYRDRYYTQTS